ncbi:hypothetical protein [Sinomonas gamaensis]|uniref:hypothetical protein n=1 Tax=Sinomonas gamaensis TaxID=2565624 RepID=UPI00148720DC|nr:hypothetical protein [Sinomonas gamaensis]
MPSRTGIFTVWFDEPAETWTSTSEPGTPPTWEKVTGVDPSRWTLPFLGTVTVTGLEFAVDSETVRSWDDVLYREPMRRPAASGPGVVAEPLLPEETMSTLRSCREPTSARTPSEAEYWMDVCCGLIYPQPVAVSRPTPRAAARATRAAGVEAVKRTARSCRWVEEVWSPLA